MNVAPEFNALTLLKLFLRKVQNGFDLKVTAGKCNVAGAVGNQKPSVLRKTGVAALRNGGCLPFGSRNDVSRHRIAWHPGGRWNNFTNRLTLLDILYQLQCYIVRLG